MGSLKTSQFVVYARRLDIGAFNFVSVNTGDDGSALMAIGE